MTDENLSSDIAPEVQSEPQEKMLPQSQVNEIVRAAQARAADKARAEMSQQQSQSAPTMQGQFDADSLRKMIAEETQKAQSAAIMQERQRQQEAQANEIAQQIMTKLSAGKEKYEDFDNVVHELGIAQFPELMQMGNQMDNLPDIVYELGNNPSKIANLAMLYEKNPNLAFKEMKKLSESIKSNEHAKASQYPTPKPLSAVTPSINARDSGRPMSVSELRKLPAFRK